MTNNEAADAIMEVMQEFVNVERKKVWNKHQDWRKIAMRFIQFYIDNEAKSSRESLNQVYAKGQFAGASVRSVVDHAKLLLKLDKETEEG